MFKRAEAFSHETLSRSSDSSIRSEFCWPTKKRADGRTKHSASPFGTGEDDCGPRRTSQRTTNHIQALEQREQQRSLVTYGNAAKLDFSEVKLDLAGFDRGCQSEHDRAAAMAMVEKAPVLTYMGGAAMNCTERVKKILDKLVDTLDKQR